MSPPLAIRVPVSAMRAGDEVVVVQRGNRADRRGLFADIDVEGAVELVLAGEELLLDALFPPAGLEHLGVHVDELVLRQFGEPHGPAVPGLGPVGIRDQRRRAGERRRAPSGTIGVLRCSWPWAAGTAAPRHRCPAWRRRHPTCRISSVISLVTSQRSGWSRTCDIFFLLDVRRRSPSQTRRSENKASKRLPRARRRASQCPSRFQATRIHAVRILSHRAPNF